MLAQGPPGRAAQHALQKLMLSSQQMVIKPGNSLNHLHSAAGEWPAQQHAGLCMHAVGHNAGSVDL